MDIVEAAKYCLMKKETLAGHCARGTGPAYKQGGVMIFNKPDLDRWMVARVGAKRRSK